MTPPIVTSALPPVENVGTSGVEETTTLPTQHMYSSEFEYLLAEEEAHVSILLSVAACRAPHLLGSGSVKPSRTSGINMQFVQAFYEEEFRIILILCLSVMTFVAQT